MFVAVWLGGTGDVGQVTYSREIQLRLHNFNKKIIIISHFIKIHSHNTLVLYLAFKNPMFASHLAMPHNPAAHRQSLLNHLDTIYGTP